MCRAQLVFQRADMVVTDGRRSSSSDCKTVLKHNFYCFILSRSLLCVRKWGFPELTFLILLFDISDADAFSSGGFSCLCCPKPAPGAVPGSEGAAAAAPRWVEGKILDLRSAQKRGIAAFWPQQKSTWGFQWLDFLVLDQLSSTYSYPKMYKRNV